MELSVSAFICNNQRILDVLPVFADSSVRNLELWAAFRFGSEHHFPYWEKGYANKIINGLEKFGLKGVTMHAPFSDNLDISSLDESLRKDAVREIKEASLVFGRLPGAEIVVVHPGGFLTRAEEEKARLGQSRKSVVELDSFLGKNNLRLAVENILPGMVGWKISDVSSLIEGLANSGICLDTGHAHIAGILETIPNSLVDEIIAFHISDTYDREDRHLIPFEGTINWPMVMEKIIRKVKPDVLTFETRKRGNLSKDLKEIKTAYRKL